VINLAHAASAIFYFDRRLGEFTVFIAPSSCGRMGRRMYPARIYVGQITIVFGIVVVSTWGATQWTAAALGYQARLGAP
jgi:hypothetical protein